MANSIVIAICKRAYVPLSSDNDPVIPDNTGALKLGLMALQYEDKSDRDRAIPFWNDGYALLDIEREEIEQAEVPVFNVRGDFGAGQIVNVR